VATEKNAKIQKKRRAKTEISIAVGKAIAARRIIVGWTQQQLADKLKIEKETVSRIENGVMAQTVDRLDELSKIFGCPIAAFFTEEKRDITQYAAAIEHMIAPLSEDRQKRVVECVARIVGAWEDRQATLKK
jgi:transcriptional regulator with XRE-family HTH domain